jgi:hypothetical protein
MSPDLVGVVAEQEAEIEELRAALRRVQRAHSKSRAKEKEVVGAVLTAARDAALSVYGPRPKLSPRPARDRRKGRAENVALLDTGDWQGTKITPSYGTAKMRERVRFFTERCVNFSEETRLVRPVRRAAVLFGGDMIEGLWNFPTQAFEVEEEPIAQVVIVAEEMVTMIETLLAEFEEVDVFAEWGNHGRVGSKRDAVPKHTNLDRMAFIMAEQRLRPYVTAGRLRWHMGIEDVVQVEIGNYRALNIHGDEFGRNGFASPMTIKMHADRWRSGAYRPGGKPWVFRDLYVHHYHVHMELPMSNGEGSVFWTGSTESENRYAMIGMASSAIPSQRLHMIDPEAGLVVGQTKVYLPE